MYTILIVEDEEVNMKLATELLLIHEYHVLQAWDGKEGIRLAVESKPDLILMDIEMPIMGGLDAMRELKLNPETQFIKIVAVTAKAMVGDEELIRAAGADYYLSKPYKYQALLDIVKSCCPK
jgi:two-component system cell cycle response regulator DivK